MVTITLTPNHGVFDALRARVHPPLNGQVVIDTVGGAGTWTGPAQEVEIAVTGTAGSTFDCSVTGTKINGAKINHVATHSLNQGGGYREKL